MNMKIWRGIAVAAWVAAMGAGCAMQDDEPAAGFAHAQADAPWPQARMGAAHAGDTAGMLAAAPTRRAGPPQPPPLDTSRLVTAEIMDQAGFGRAVPAWRVQIPAGWQTTGGVVWNDAANCHSNMVQTAWSAIGPDSLSVIELMPNFGWQVQGTQIQTDPCPVAPFRSAREFLQAAAKQSRPEARVLDYMDRPEWVQEAERNSERAMRETGMNLSPGQTRRFEAGSLLLAFEKDGIEMREMLSTVVNFTQLNGNISAVATGVVSYRAPNDRLDLKLIDRILGTAEQDKQWQAMAMPRLKQNIERYFSGQRRKIDEWHSRQMAIINARGMADRHAIRMRGNREVAGIYNQIAANTSATSDRMHRRGLEAIGEYNTHAGVQGTQVQSSIHGGSQVFQSTQDPSRAYSTDEPYPNPPDDYVELQRVP